MRDSIMYQDGVFCIVAVCCFLWFYHHVLQDGVFVSELFLSSHYPNIIMTIDTLRLAHDKVETTETAYMLKLLFCITCYYAQHLNYYYYTCTKYVQLKS